MTDDKWCRHDGFMHDAKLGCPRVEEDISEAERRELMCAAHDWRFGTDELRRVLGALDEMCDQRDKARTQAIASVSALRGVKLERDRAYIAIEKVLAIIADKTLTAGDIADAIEEVLKDADG